MDLAVKPGIPLAVIGFALAVPASGATDWTKVERLPRMLEEQTAKDWALSVCVGKLAQHTELASDASRTAAALLERGSYSPDVYDRMTKLVDRFIARPYGGSTGGSYNLLKCLDLHHSRELDELLKTTGTKLK